MVLLLSLELEILRVRNAPALGGVAEEREKEAQNLRCERGLGSLDRPLAIKMF